MPEGTRDVPREVIGRAARLLGEIFDAARARHLVDSIDRGPSGDSALDRALFVLRLEYLTDRMPGYVRHIEQIDAEVFDRHRDAYVADLGFNPGDVTRVVRRQVARCNSELVSALRRVRKTRPNTRELAVGVHETVMLMDRTRDWDPEEVAMTTGVGVGAVSAMLAYFSTTWNSQPDFRTPADTNIARLWPCIDVGTGTYFVPDPWSLSAAVHPRLGQDALDATGVLKRYADHRAKAHQRLVGGALRRLFGAVVHEEQHYTSAVDGHGEVDALVAVDWPLVVEAKGRALTEPGRRGAPARVRTVTKDVVEKALTQTGRARAFIADEGGRDFAEHEGDPPATRLPVIVEGVTEAIITFERMDPIATVGAALVGEHGRPVWICGLADLLMCTAILSDPASFHHYVRVRAQANAAGVHVTMESDALSGYLVDRLAPNIELATANPDTTVELGYSSSAVNEYFTVTETGTDTKAPTTGVPVQVTAALAHGVGEPGWRAFVDAVMGVDAGTWKRFKRYARRHTAGLFDITDMHRLDLSGQGITVDGGAVTLGVAAPGGSTPIKAER
jgi:hypothetical protein